MNDPFIELAYSHILRKIASGDSPAQAVARLHGMHIPAEVIDAAKNKYDADTLAVIQKEPRMLRGSTVTPWYPGPQPDDVFWPALLHQLRDVERWAEEDILSLDSSSTGIVSAIENPGAHSFNVRGLIIGYVQSGKTASYTAVIAKAADAGYRHFIVVAGVTEKLRRQTQSRLLRELHGLNPQRWWVLTSLESDVGALLKNDRNAAATLSDNSQFRNLLVVKKNAAVLRRVYAWLQSAGEELLARAPFLIIDDEADEASINASATPGGRTAVNRRMNQLASLPRVSYVAYTATPFANLVINPQADDLYPRDFIDDLPRPASYFGPERIFGRSMLSASDDDAAEGGMDVIRIIPDSEIPLIKVPSRESRYSFIPAITPSLSAALRWFLLTVAARAARGQEKKHSTMLVHTSQYTATHRTMREVLSAELERISSSLKRGESAEINMLEKLWIEESSAVPADTLGCEAVEWPAVRNHLLAVIDRCQVVVENAGNAGLDYELKDGSSYVVVGGNVLARGLTLEGLTVSFFLRTAGAYDTLLQMGRWFGYRPGYGDLPRIWMTSELEGHFRDLATVEQEIRLDIRRYRDENKTPMQFGVKIRTHPSLLITSRLKQRDAIVVRTSFFNTRPQTIMFKHRDTEWLDANLRATEELCSRLNTLSQPLESGAPSLLYKDVPFDAITSFFQAYRFHERNRVFTRDLILRFLAAANVGRTRISSWDVAIVQTGDSAAPSIDLGLPASVRMVSRTRLNLRSDMLTADIGALTSPSDLGLGLSDAVGPESASAILGRRRAELEGCSLLLIYVINPNSTPSPATQRKQNRIPLDALKPVVGIAVVFPDSSDDGATIENTYIAANLPEIEVDPDFVPDDENTEDEE